MNTDDQFTPDTLSAPAQQSRRTTSKSAASSLMAGNFGKLPPQAVDLEEAILGALMLEKDALTSVIDILSEESFTRTFTV